MIKELNVNINVDHVKVKGADNSWDELVGRVRDVPMSSSPYKKMENRETRLMDPTRSRECQYIIQESQQVVDSKGYCM